MLGQYKKFKLLKMGTEKCVWIFLFHYYFLGIGTHVAILRQEERLWPHGVFIPPTNAKRMGYGPNEIENTDYEVWRKYKNNYAIKCRDMLC